jgi:cell division protein FtsB
MSKEMIHSKIKAKKLKYTIQNNKTYIVVEKLPSDLKTKSTTKPQPPATKTKPTVGMIISLYQKENKQLKEKIVELEAKIDKLIDDKEQMLRDEIKKIETLYAKKDEQLKSIVELLNAKFTTQTQEMQVMDVQKLSHIDEIQEEQESNIVELKEYLKHLDLQTHEKKEIKKRFSKAYGEDIRILKDNGKIYLNLKKYDYSDLLKN